MSEDRIVYEYREIYTSECKEKNWDYAINVISSPLISYWFPIEDRAEVIKRVRGQHNWPEDAKIFARALYKK